MLHTFPQGCTVGRCTMKALIRDDTEERKRLARWNNGNVRPLPQRSTMAGGFIVHLAISSAIESILAMS